MQDISQKITMKSRMSSKIRQILPTWGNNLPPNGGFYTDNTL